MGYAGKAPPITFRALRQIESWVRLGRVSRLYRYQRLVRSNEFRPIVLVLLLVFFNLVGRGGFASRRYGKGIGRSNHCVGAFRFFDWLQIGSVVGPGSGDHRIFFVVAARALLT